MDSSSSNSHLQLPKPRSIPSGSKQAQDASLDDELLQLQHTFNDVIQEHNGLQGLQGLYDDNLPGAPGPQNFLLPNNDYSFAYSNLTLPQSTWWNADSNGRLDSGDQNGAKYSMVPSHGIENEIFDSTLWSLNPEPSYMQQIPYADAESQFPAYEYVGSETNRGLYDQLPLVHQAPLSSASALSHPSVVAPLLPNGLMFNQNATKTANKSASSSDSSQSPRNVAEIDNHDLDGMSPTVQRLATLVKQQQKTIDLLLREVTRRPRRKSKASDSKVSGKSNAGSGQTSNQSTSSAVVKNRAKRSALDPIARVDTAETREIAACIRCQRVKKRCRMGANAFEPCLDCIAVNPLSLRIPCIRFRVTDAILFRTNTSEKDTWTVRPEVFKLSDLSTIVPSPIKRLELTHDLGSTLCVYVQEFTPVEGDITSYTHKLKDGTLLVTEMPCYAITQLEDTKAAINAYVDISLVAYLECHFDDSDFLIWETFQLAIKRACWQDSLLLKKALRLWMASRLTERPWRICGEETLGMSIIEDPKSPFCGRIPVPPVMDTQLDQVVIQSILIPLRQQVLKLLSERISKKQRKDWFEIYATIFILLNNVEVATAHDHDFAQRYGHYTPGRGSRFEDYRLVEGYFHSAQALIAHFRDALHGQKPFTLDWVSSDLKSVSEVNSEEARYLQVLGRHLDKKKSEYAQLKECHRYESMLYWGHQLFADSWDASQVQIREID